MTNVVPFDPPAEAFKAANDSIIAAQEARHKALDAVIAAREAYLDGDEENYPDVASALDDAINALGDANTAWNEAMCFYFDLEDRFPMFKDHPRGDIELPAGSTAH